MGEDHGLRTVGGDLREFGDEQGDLAGMRRRAGRIVGQQARVAADLTQTHQQREHGRRVLRKQRSEFARQTAALGEMLVKRTLFVRERTRKDDFHLRRDVGGDMALETAQDERRDLPTHLAERDGGVTEHQPLEAGALTEQAGHQEAEDGPKVRGTVLERRTGDRDAVVGLERDASLRGLRLRVLDRLGFVEHGITETGLRE